MVDFTLILVGSGVLLCLTPLAAYLLYLSHLNGQSTPRAVPGPWDLAAALLGLSGFILLFGPLLITLIDSAWRSNVYGGWSTLRNVGRREAWAGSLMATGYLVTLGGVVGMLLRSRRGKTAIYNVEPSQVEPTLARVLEESEQPWRKTVGGFEISPTKDAVSHDPIRVRVDAFVSLGHATLCWAGPYPGQREAIEAALLPRLPARHGGRNAVATWLTTAAVAVMVADILWLVVLFYLIMTMPTR